MFYFLVAICQKCAGFKSSYTCGCGESYVDHTMVVETKAEREARGHPVGVNVPYQAMGGLTGYSSLAEGYMRLDPSGRGAPSQEWLGQEITASDNTFLRAAVPSIQAHRRALKGNTLVFGLSDLPILKERDVFSEAWMSSVTHHGPLSKVLL